MLNNFLDFVIHASDYSDRSSKRINELDYAKPCTLYNNSSKLKLLKMSSIQYLSLNIFQ